MVLDGYSKRPGEFAEYYRTSLLQPQNMSKECRQQKSLCSEPSQIPIRVGKKKKKLLRFGTKQSTSLATET